VDNSDRAVSITSVVIASLMPLSVAILAAILLAQTGPHEVLLGGVPGDSLRSLHVASEHEAEISRDAAIANAREALPGRPEGSANARIRDVALGRYSEDALVGDFQRGRLVWVVSFADPDEVGQGHFGGPFDRDRSCDWALHVRFVYVEIDAQSGSILSSAEGGELDPTRPPRSADITITDDERARCERLVREWKASE
jgi:hypothetical protein